MPAFLELLVLEFVEPVLLVLFDEFALDEFAVLFDELALVLVFAALVVFALV